MTRRSLPAVLASVALLALTAGSSGQQSREEKQAEEVERGGAEEKLTSGFRTFQARRDTAPPDSTQTPQTLLANMEYWRVTLDELHTSVVGEVGLAWGVYTEEFKAEGQPPATVRVRFTNALRRHGQGWENLLYHRDAQQFGENGEYQVRE